jgi:muconate cycloisomerase
LKVKTVQIDKINIFKIELPFKGNFSIARIKGFSSTTIIVEIIADQGRLKGYGEGLPVEFVTGETAQTTIRNISTLTREKLFPWNLEDVTQVWHFVDSLSKGMEQNAAICALEMALLDLLGKHQQKYILDYFPQNYSTEVIYYGAQITLGDKEHIFKLCRNIKKFGIRHLRIKMDKNFSQNKDALETVARVFNGNAELRIDPNGVWDRELAFKHIPLIEKHKVRIVEEPMPKSSSGFRKFVATMKAMGITLMACETLEAVETIIREQYYDMVNVKLCRGGGFRRSFRMIDRLRSSGISFQIGCTLGESGILSAAGRILGLLCRDASNFDGSYDQFLLKENTTLENVSFGPGGKAGALSGHGLGVTVSRSQLERLCDTSSSLSIVP